MLVKAFQKFRFYDFSLNICEPESDPDIDSSRVWGLKFRTVPKNATSVGDENEYEVYKPHRYQLHNNYPNPFNSSTQITFSLQAETLVDMSIYNIKGQRIKTLLKQSIAQSGVHRLHRDASNDNGMVVSARVYLVRLTANNNILFNNKSPLYQIRTKIGNFLNRLKEGST